MKKGYILLSFVLIIIILMGLLSLNFLVSSYTPKLFIDTKNYIQAQILATNASNLAKLFLESAKNEGKECLNYAKINYPSQSDTIRIDYFYPLSKCENYTFTSHNKDANLSKDSLIIVNISVHLNTKAKTNDEIFISKRIILKPKPNFWIKTQP